MLSKLNKCLSDRNTQLRIVKHFLILVTVLSAVVYIIGFQMRRTEWHQYYELELEDHGFDDKVIAKFSEIMFIASIVFTIVFTLIFIHLVAKEILVGILVICILELVSLIYSIALINQPIGLTSIEFLISAVEVMTGFMFSYLLKQKINEKNKKRMEETECFAA